MSRDGISVPLPAPPLPVFPSLSPLPVRHRQLIQEPGSSSPPPGHLHVLLLPGGLPLLPRDVAAEHVGGHEEGEDGEAQHAGDTHQEPDGRPGGDGEGVKTTCWSEDDILE